MTHVIQRNDARWTFDTVAAMRALPTAAIRGTDVAILKGGSSLNDGTGGLYVWDSSSSASDNGTTIIKPTDNAGNGRFLAMDSTNQGAASGGNTVYINVQDEGLVGDGSTDNSSALTTLLASSTVTTRQITLFFPAGDYNFGSAVDLDESVRFLGEGTTGTRLICTHIGNAFNIDPSAGFLEYDFEQITIAKNGSSGGKGVNIAPSTAATGATARFNSFKCTSISGTFDDEIYCDCSTAQVVLQTNDCEFFGGTDSVHTLGATASRLFWKGNNIDATGNVNLVGLTNRS